MVDGLKRTSDQGRRSIDASPTSSVEPMFSYCEDGNDNEEDNHQDTPTKDADQSRQDDDLEQSCYGWTRQSRCSKMIITVIAIIAVAWVVAAREQLFKKELNILRESIAQLEQMVPGNVREGIEESRLLSMATSMWASRYANDGMLEPPPVNDPALEIKAEGYRPKHPVYLIPGFTTNGLDVWQGSDCTGGTWFRRRIWGLIDMPKILFLEAICGMHQLSLNPITGFDHDDVHVRAGNGLDEIDYFLGDFHVWSPLIAGLGRFGYDPVNIGVGNLDWRLSPHHADDRDGVFVRFTTDLERLVETTGHPAVIVSHSYGDVMFRSWLRRMELRSLAAEEGKDSPRMHGWLNRHVKAYFSIGAPMLGVPKALAALVAGEFKDTMDNPMTKLMGDVLIPPSVRAAVWRSWPALRQMLPSPLKDDEAGLIFVEDVDAEPPFTTNVLSMPQAIEYLDTVLEGQPDKTKRWREDDLYNDTDRRNFNYLNDPLTIDPSTKLDFFCFYGVSIPTEAGYLVGRQVINEISNIVINDGKVPEDRMSNFIKIHRIADAIDDECYHLDNERPCVKVSRGMIIDPNGDGTVTHRSTSHLCRNAWQDRRLNTTHTGIIAESPTTSPSLNPHNQRVVVSELLERQHQTDTIFQRVGGAANHVDVIGNYEILENLITVVSGKADVESTQFRHTIIITDEEATSMKRMWHQNGEKREEIEKNHKDDMIENMNSKDEL